MTTTKDDRRLTEKTSNVGALKQVRGDPEYFDDFKLALKNFTK